MDQSRRVRIASTQAFPKSEAFPNDAVLLVAEPGTMAELVPEKVLTAFEDIVEVSGSFRRVGTDEDGRRVSFNLAKQRQQIIQPRHKFPRSAAPSR